MSWVRAHPALWRVLLILYYLAFTAGLIAIYGRGNFSTPPFVYQGFSVNLIEQIDHWALAVPNAIAHISGDKRLTYGELRRRSDALAAHLRNRFGNDRSPIAVLGHREPEMLIAFLGAVKSRRPYVPLDTILPQQRIDKILAISRPALLLTPEDVTKLSSSAPFVPATRVQRDDPFYILFTSGSTGEPKGVIITLGAGALRRVDAWGTEVRPSRRDLPEHGALFIRSLGDGSVLQPHHGRHPVQHKPRFGCESENALSRAWKFRRYDVGLHAIVCTNVPG